MAQEPSIKLVYFVVDRESQGVIGKAYFDPIYAATAAGKLNKGKTAARYLVEQYYWRKPYECVNGKCLRCGGGTRTHYEYIVCIRCGQNSQLLRCVTRHPHDGLHKDGTGREW